MLVMPTFSLLINLSQFGVPLALSKLISEDTRNNKKLILSNMPILIFINIILIITTISLAPIISNKLLHNKNTYLAILSITLVIPFTTISSICRSYFFGKEQMLPHVISNITEDLIRYIILLLFLPKIIMYKVKYIVSFLILINIISELTSTIVLIFFLPNNISISKQDLKPNKSYIKDSLKISIPNTASRLIGSISYFLEPIILTTNLLKNYTNNYITHEYGIISGYVIPILLLPSFFTLAISQALLPIISKEYVKKNYKYVLNKIKITIILTLFFATIIVIIIYIYSPLLLRIIYKTKDGINYLKILAPVFFLQYIQSPLSFSLDAIGQSKINLKTSIISIIVRTTSLLILTNLKIGIYSLIISLIINIIITTSYQLIKIYNHFKNLSY
jgi:stage V sporulation protein B